MYQLPEWSSILCFINSNTEKFIFTIITDEIFDPETDVRLEETDSRKRTEVVYKEERVENIAMDSDFLQYSR